MNGDATNMLRRVVETWERELSNERFPPQDLADLMREMGRVMAQARDFLRKHDLDAAS